MSNDDYFYMRYLDGLVPDTPQNRARVERIEEEARRESDRRELGSYLRDDHYRDQTTF